MSMQGEIRQNASRGSMPPGVRLAVLAAAAALCLGALYLIAINVCLQPIVHFETKLYISLRRVYVRDFSYIS